MLSLAGILLIHYSIIYANNNDSYYPFYIPILISYLTISIYTYTHSLLGLLHVHEQRSIHRDIKAGNILLSSSGKAMLSDFGISTKLTGADARRKTGLDLILCTYTILYT